MMSDATSTVGRRRLRHTLAAGLLLVVLLPGVAAASEGESDQAAVLVQQAISLLANGNPPDVVLERVVDAAGAPDKKGVDVALVERAAALLKPVARDGGLAPATAAQVRAALEGAIGGENATKPVDMTTGANTGTTRVLEEYRPARGVSDGGDVALLVLAAAAVAGGVVTARWLRPHHSLRDLRRPTTTTTTEGRPA